MKKFLLILSFCFCAALAACSKVEAASQTSSDNLTLNTDEVTNNRGVSFILQMCSSKAQKQDDFFKRVYKNADVLNAGWLYGATSNPDKCTNAKTFLKDTRPKRIRVHVCNSTCFPERQRKCDSKECFAGFKTAKEASNAILKGDKNTYKRIDRIISMIRSDYGLAPKDKNGASTIIDFAVSSCMECTLTRDARKKLNDYVKDKLKDINKNRTKQGLREIVWVDNPLESSDSCFSDMYCEKHGHPRVGSKGIADNDGEDYDTIAQYDYWNKNRGAFMVLAWKPCLNGAASVAGTSGAGGWVYPKDRTGWCKNDREGPEFAVFTNKKLTLPIQYKKDQFNKKDLQGCNKFEEFGKTFVWKLSDGRNFTTWVAPNTYPKFKTVQLMCAGKVVDYSAAKPGKRFGTDYKHDTGKKRKIYDFQKSLAEYPQKCVLHADKYCWLMSTPFFRPVAK